jgi:hypothetical protein
MAFSEWDVLLPEALYYALSPAHNKSRSADDSGRYNIQPAE